jgi:hypothetical protein
MENGKDIISALEIELKKEQSQKYYWVLGSTKNGFKIKDKQPKGKYVPEPIMGLENAKRWIAMEFLLNA